MTSCPAASSAATHQPGLHQDIPMERCMVHWILLESERDPKNDPLVVWYQGGPGASSLYGLFVEFGPLRLNELSMQHYNETGVPALIPNEYSWTKFANVLVIDNPPPVGFSYCDPVGPTGNGDSCGAWNDSLVATANHAMLSEWIKQMPDYAHLDMYITGESYAGVYVPTIVRAILNDPRGLNLKGFAVGDGCLGTEVLCGPSGGPYWNVEFMHGHGQFSNKLYNSIQSTCTETELKQGNLSTACHALIQQMNTEIGGYYGYNLYDTCYAQHVFAPNPSSSRQYWSSAVGMGVGGALNDYPCPGDALNIWVNLTEARQALHVPVSSTFFNGDNGAGMKYSLTEPDLLPFYEHVVRNTSLRVLVYNGDTDPGINSFVTQDKYVQYFDSKGLRETETWRPWTLDGKKQVAGYVFGYESNFHYLTIRGSGHMVPEFKPQAAQSMLQFFLADKNWPAYNP
ncbi:hypothetical protein PTSG_02974 [Salpingoeca rosetta]|uniref:Carboxypeptidase n=1 Tax=Salpingoeca rosetta (strain ATCC 50818 / BSB-021) TaxID=946362 RepID=F2U3W2_SALR5|nr:uncharacterized protein PTSG_02974 [Salpingoeca rosetta]EGD82306.1 hypothetical protein PTSG_02974 [Salpingoeca rosetta]|eukprot:XP_004996489.1 hypothetical protein PTSG_02974 [Salpingoeca rosetta]